MTTAHEIYQTAVRDLPRSERLRLAALILDELAVTEEAAGGSPSALNCLEDQDDLEASRRAERMTPRLGELERIIAAGTRPRTWHDGDEPLF